MSQTVETTSLPARRGILRSIGPGIIVASVVLGPGSILTSSKIGTQFGYGMLWLVVVAAVLMMGMMALGARLGITLRNTPCSILAERFGRPVAVAIGLILFGMIALFQSGNNVAVLSALTLLFPVGEGAQQTFSIVTLVILNVVIVATLFGFKHLYRPIERLMMVLVMIMLIAFVTNLVAAAPSILAVLGGFIPILPQDASRNFVPFRGDGGAVVDPWWPIQGFLATTFSVAGAFYQAYLVREKGWGINEVRQGTTDSLAGIAILGGISVMIMVTAGSVLYGKVDPDALKGAGDVARQLEPAFGQWAKILFSVGLFAAAFSSFLVNAAVGGTILSDSLKLGSSIDQTGPRTLTTAALAVGMIFALLSPVTGLGDVNVIVYAQALTVLGLPVLALSMIYLALRSRQLRPGYIPNWMLIVVSIGTLVSIVLAIRTAVRLYIQFTT